MALVSPRGAIDLAWHHQISGSPEATGALLLTTAQGLMAQQWGWLRIASPMMGLLPLGVLIPLFTSEGPGLSTKASDLAFDPI